MSFIFNQGTLAIQAPKEKQEAKCKMVKRKLTHAGITQNIAFAALPLSVAFVSYFRNEFMTVQGLSLYESFSHMRSHLLVTSRLTLPWHLFEVWGVKYLSFGYYSPNTLAHSRTCIFMIFVLYSVISINLYLVVQVYIYWNLHCNIYYSFLCLRDRLM